MRTTTNTGLALHAWVAVGYEGRGTVYRCSCGVERTAYITTLGLYPRASRVWLYRTGRVGAFSKQRMPMHPRAGS